VEAVPISRPRAAAGALALAALTAGASQAFAARHHTAPKTDLAILMTSPNAADVVTEARALGLHTVRFSQDAANPKRRPGFAVFRRAGFRMVLTVNYDQRPANGGRPSHPPVGAAALATYRRRLASLLDATGRPALLQVGNEEIAPRFFTGTMPQYVAQLNAAVSVAHRRGIKVTNGGLTSEPVALLTWDDLRRHGHAAEADRFAARAFSDPNDRWILRDLRAKPFRGLRRAALQAGWDRARQLIPAFRASHMDYVNFHWYHHDARALAPVVAYLRRATRKPVVTTEIGQYDLRADVVTADLRAVVSKLRLPFVVWFDADGMPARGLHDAPGRLRANGRAFRAYVEAHRALLR